MRFNEKNGKFIMLPKTAKHRIHVTPIEKLLGIMQLK